MSSSYAKPPPVTDEASPSPQLPTPGDALSPTKSMTESAKAAEAHLTGIRLFLLVASVSFIAFLLLLDQSILSTAIPKITSQFHSLPDVGWYSGAYQLAA